jgi:hypothetical protein
MFFRKTKIKIIAIGEINMLGIIVLQYRGPGVPGMMLVDPKLEQPQPGFFKSKKKQVYAPKVISLSQSSSSENKVFPRQS